MEKNNLPSQDNHSSTPIVLNINIKKKEII